MICAMTSARRDSGAFGMVAAAQAVRFAKEPATITKSAALPAQEHCDGI